MRQKYITILLQKKNQNCSTTSDIIWLPLPSMWHHTGPKEMTITCLKIQIKLLERKDLLYLCWMYFAKSCWLWHWLSSCQNIPQDKILLSRWKILWCKNIYLWHNATTTLLRNIFVCVTINYYTTISQ
jgi:hypothetical protein